MVSATVVVVSAARGYQEHLFGFYSSGGGFRSSSYGFRSSDGGFRSTSGGFRRSSRADTSVAKGELLLIFVGDAAQQPPEPVCGSRKEHDI